MTKNNKYTKLKTAGRSENINLPFIMIALQS